jgi:hypothetical protein
VKLALLAAAERISRLVAHPRQANREFGNKEATFHGNEGNWCCFQFLIFWLMERRGILRRFRSRPPELVIYIINKFGQ